MSIRISLILFPFIIHAMRIGCIAQTISDENSPYGITTLSTTNKTISFANEVGATSVRLAGPQAIIWDRVKSQGWSENDKIISDFYNSGLEISVVVLAGNPAASGNLTAYSNFISEMAERYDGDGIKDAPGSPIVTYYEIDNEPDLYEPNEKSDWKGNIAETKDYALVLKTAYEAIISASPHAKVTIAGMAFAAPNSKQYYDSILTELDKLKTNGDDKYFDVYNFHYYGFYYDYLVNQISDVKFLLSKHGYANTEIIITETATYSGTSMFGGISNNLPYQSEAQQAESLVKRYMYAKAHGISRIYWYMQHAENGLSSPGGDKLLAYYSFRKMVGFLQGSDWKNIEIIRDTDGIRMYKFEKQGLPLWIAWIDSSQARTLTLSGMNLNRITVTETVPKDTSGKEVADFATAFRIDTLTVTNGKVLLTLHENPVFIESVTITSVEDVSKNIPHESLLHQNYPNPFSSSTAIIYHLSSRGHVRLEVFDLLGRKIATLVDEEKEAGEYTSKFSAGRFADIHTGVYFYKLIFNSSVLMRKMIIIK